MPTGIEILGTTSEIEVIAVGGSLRINARLHKQYVQGRWRKLKGIATVRLPDDTVVTAEIHWYEAHGIGRRDFKIKRMIAE